MRRSDSSMARSLDARLAPSHEPVLIELPQLVAVAAPPLAVAVMALVLEAHRDPVVVKGPQALAQRILQLALPLLGEERDDVGPSGDEPIPVAPHRVLGVGAGHALWIPRVPGVLGGLHFLCRGLGGKGGQRWAVGHGGPP